MRDYVYSGGGDLLLRVLWVPAELGGCVSPPQRGQRFEIVWASHFQEVASRAVDCAIFEAQERDEALQYDLKVAFTANWPEMQARSAPGARVLLHRVGTVCGAGVVVGVSRRTP